MKINLISDTVTRPTPGMLDAMMNAKVGDDVFKEDPSVNALEEKIALMFGMESALFFPSGTMTNQAAIKLHTQPGEQLICDKYAHVFNYEGGGVSFNSGVSCRFYRLSRARIYSNRGSKAGKCAGRSVRRSQHRSFHRTVRDQFEICGYTLSLELPFF